MIRTSEEALKYFQDVAQAANMPAAINKRRLTALFVSVDGRSVEMNAQKNRPDSKYFDVFVMQSDADRFITPNDPVPPEDRVFQVSDTDPRSVAQHVVRFLT